MDERHFNNRQMNFAFKYVLSFLISNSRYAKYISLDSLDYTYLTTQDLEYRAVFEAIVAKDNLFVFSILGDIDNNDIPSVEKALSCYSIFSKLLESEWGNNSFISVDQSKRCFDLIIVKEAIQDSQTTVPDFQSLLYEIFPEAIAESRLQLVMS